MANTTLSALSDELGTLAAAGAASVLQVLGARRPASGVVHGPDTIVTTARAIGREDGLRIRTADGEAIDANLAGWDAATGIAVLRTTSPLNITAPAVASDRTARRRNRRGDRAVVEQRRDRQRRNGGDCRRPLAHRTPADRSRESFA